MLLGKIKKSIELRLCPSFKMPDDEMLEEYLFESLVYICMKCEPVELLCEDEGDHGEKVLRHLDNGHFIKAPERPDFSKEERHLQIDESLTYSAINYVCFLVSGESRYRILQDEFIKAHQQSLYMNFLGDDND